MTTSSILDEINDDEKFIEAQTPRFESFEENLRPIEETRRRIAGADTDSTTKQNNEINNLLSQQLRNAKTTMLRLHNLQRARLLEQQFQKITIRAQALKSDLTEFESSETSSLKNADAQSANVQSTIFEKLNATVAADALLSQITLSSKSKIIKFEKMRIYKSQSENEHQR